ncbi:MAG: hypothetical protein JST22_06330 [Bacteroidetes bacterium]|nr:hypothetical protein [Bacteroidota bacterium]
MRRSPAFAAVLLLALVSAQVDAQTATPAPSKATRIEYTASYAATNLITRAVLTDGQQSTALVFSEVPGSTDITSYAFWQQTYATDAIMVTPGMAIACDAYSVVRVTAMPPPEFRRVPLHVLWQVRIGLRDSLGKLLEQISPEIDCDTPAPIDTVISFKRSVDLSHYIGKRVHLVMLVRPDLTAPMVMSRRRTVLDCTDTQPLYTIK